MSKEELKLFGQQFFMNAFSSGGFFITHKELLLYYGPNMATFIVNLVDKHKYHEENGTLKNGRWFYLTHKRQYLETGLSEKLIRSCKKKLREEGLISTKMIGIPAKEHYSFNWERAIPLANTIHEYRLSCIKKMKEEEVGLDLTPEVGLEITPGVGLNINNKDINTKTILDNSQNNLKRLFIESSSVNDDGNSGLITSKLFGKFWELYPKKSGKGAALTAWNKLCTKKSGDRPAWRILRRAVIEQKKTEQWQNPMFIPNASTWLNQSRWLDNPDEMKSWKKDNTNTKTKKSGFVGKDKLNYGQSLKIKV